MGKMLLWKVGAYFSLLQPLPFVKSYNLGSHSGFYVLEKFK
jgi:hypothetical protein